MIALVAWKIAPQLVFVDVDVLEGFLEAISTIFSAGMSNAIVAIESIRAVDSDTVLKLYVSGMVV